MSQPVPPPVVPRSRSRILLPVLLGLGVLTLVAAFLVPLPTPTVPGTPPGPAASDAPLSEVPAFTLTERSGEPVSKADLLGKVWVASFVFTHCSGPCPSVTGTMAKLQADLNLADHPDLRLVTFTVDPDRDDPAALTKYAENFRAHPDRWLFLTGEDDQINALLRDGFHVHAAPAENPHPAAGQEFDHSTRLVVVDKTGQIRGYFDGYPGPNDDGGAGYHASYDALKAAVAELLRE